jgi:hypothetical protein
MRRFFTLLAILIISHLAALVFAPPDAGTLIILTGLCSFFGVAGYLVGIREGREQSRIVANNN